MLFESEKVASPGSGHNGSWAFDADVAPGPWLHTLIGQQPLRRRSSTSSTRWCAHTPIWSLERALVMPSSPPDRRKRPADSGASPSAHTRTSSHAPATPAQKTPLGLGRRLLMEASAGAIAEALVEFLLYPLDTLKQTQQLPTAHRQLIHSRHATAAAASTLAWRSASGLHWLGPVRAFQHAVRRMADGRGFRQLYAGVLSGVIGSLPTAALFAITYESVRRTLRRTRPGASHYHDQGLRANSDAGPRLFWESTTAAAMANIVSSLVDTPAELIKQRVQSCLQPNIVAAARHLWVHEGGLMALWTGYGSNLLRNLPFDALEFGTFEQFKQITQRVQGRERLAEWELLLLGMSAGGLIGVITTPLDVVRTRMLVSGTQPGRPATSVLQAIRALLGEGGVPALFQGVMPRATWEAVSSGIFFMFFDSLKTCFGVQLEPANDSD
jgi:solute carrier family 25 S-adenosylmethionine transporter 26